MKIDSSIRFGIIAFILGAVLMLLIVAFAAEPVLLARVTIVNKLFNAGLVLVIFVLYKLYFLGRTHETDRKIGEHPIALALDAGLLALAVAWSVAGAF